MKQLQKVAEFLRNAAYSDNRVFDKNMTRLEWSISAVHPSNNNGNLTFSCGIWTDSLRGRDTERRSCSFNYEVNGIGMHDLRRWKSGNEIYFPEGKFDFEQLQEVVLNLFDIKKLFEPN